MLQESVFALHISHYGPFAVVWMEWLISVRRESSEMANVEHSVTVLCIKRDTHSSRRLHRAFSEKQKIDTPVIVLTDLTNGYQRLQVLVRLVGVDVVQ